MQVVGKYQERFNTLTGQNIKCKSIYQADGLKKHVQKRHPRDIDLLNYVKDVIKKPDYIGKNPKEENSIELVKVLDNNIMGLH